MCDFSCHYGVFYDICHRFNYIKYTYMYISNMNLVNTTCYGIGQLFFISWNQSLLTEFPERWWLKPQLKNYSETWRTRASNMNTWISISGIRSNSGQFSLRCHWFKRLDKLFNHCFSSWKIKEFKKHMRSSSKQKNVINDNDNWLRQILKIQLPVKLFKCALDADDQNVNMSPSLIYSNII